MAREIESGGADPRPPSRPGGSTVAGDELSRALDDETLDVPEPAKAVVQAEGTAAEEHGGQPAVLAWLFRNREEPRAVEIADLPGLVADDPNFVWVDLSDYTESDLQRVAELLRLHHVGVRVALSAWQRPRLDVFGDQFLVSATLPLLDPAERRMKASELDFFVGRNFLVSAHKQPLPFADRVMTRAESSPELMELDAAFMLYLILDELLGYYEDLGERVQSEVEEMEERALVDTSDGFLADLLHFKRYVFSLHQLAGQHRNVFEAFLRPDFRFVQGDDLGSYFQDLQSRFSRASDALTAARDSVNGAFDIYVSHVSHRTNNVMKVLTVVATILLPATVITGFFGTNFPSVPMNTRPFFVVMVTSILLISAGLLVTFRRQGWL